jgi:hypothetical protein
MARRKDPQIPDAVLDHLLPGLPAVPPSSRAVCWIS